jgi:hypothetical protein
LLARRLVNPKKLISRVYPMSQAREACQYAAQRGVLKVLVEMPPNAAEVSVLSRPTPI